MSAQNIDITGNQNFKSFKLCSILNTINTIINAEEGSATIIH
jgi:hypothetical protein